MKKQFAGLGIFLAAGGAMAQTAGAPSVEIYGVLDVGIAYGQHTLSEDPNNPSNQNPQAQKLGNNSATTLFGNGLSPSRIGFKGAEDLGNGLKAVFTLENGFTVPYGTIANGPASVANNTAKAPLTSPGDSSLAGQLFNRQSNVGLASSELGTVTFGRNYSLGYEGLLVYDPLEGSLFSPFGFSGVYAAGGFTEDFRVDNSIKYKFKSSSGFNVGALYKLGGQAGSTNAQSELQFNAGYDNGTFGIQASYSAIKDGIGAFSSNTAGTLNATFADTTSFMLAAKYKFDPWTLRGGYERINFQNPSNPALDSATTNLFGIPVGAVTTTAFNLEKTYDVYFAGLTYDVTPAFGATVAFYDVKQNDFLNGACTTGVNVASCSGSNKFYSALTTYKMSKRTRLYAGYMYNKVDGGFSTGFLNNSNNFFGIGINHAF